MRPTLYRPTPLPASRRPQNQSEAPAKRRPDRPEVAEAGQRPDHHEERHHGEVRDEIGLTRDPTAAASAVALALALARQVTGQHIEIAARAGGVGGLHALVEL